MTAESSRRIRLRNASWTARTVRPRRGLLTWLGAHLPAHLATAKGPDPITIAYMEADMPVTLGSGVSGGQSIFRPLHKHGIPALGQP